MEARQRPYGHDHRGRQQQGAAGSGRHAELRLQRGNRPRATLRRLGDEHHAQALQQKDCAEHLIDQPRRRRQELNHQAGQYATKRGAQQRGHRVGNSTARLVDV